MPDIELRLAQSTGWRKRGLSDIIGSVISSGITHGQQVNASNTGLNYNNVSLASLTAVSSPNYSTNGATITGMDISGGAIISGNNVTLRNCRVRVPAGANNVAIDVQGSNVTIEGCLILPVSGSGYIGISVNNSGTTIRGCDVSGFENNSTISSGPTLLELSYMHDASGASNPSAHRDCVEVYGGNGTVIRKNRLTHPAGETSTINCAPWYTGTSVDGLSIVDNFLDGGIFAMIFDNQAAGIRNVQVLRNKIGGHQSGQYTAYRGPDSNDPAHVTTTSQQTSTPASVYWPVTGVDVNTWAECKDLTPNNNGQIIT